MSISSAKRMLRKNLRAVLNSMTPEEKEFQSRIITQQILQSDVFLNAKRVSIYLSTQNEVSTTEILVQLFALGKQCFIPQYDPNSRDMKMLPLGSLSELESLPVTSWNIKQHPLDMQLVDALDSGGLDLVITPGVAFTESGQRLGSGRGYYDRYLKKLMTTSSSTSSPSSFIRIIGLAFRQQVLPSLPTDEYDVSVHQVIHA